MPKASGIVVAVGLFVCFQGLLLFLHLSDAGHLLVTAFGIFVAWQIGVARFALLLASLAICVLFLELAHGAIIGKRATGGQDMLTAGRRYLPNREVEFELPYGNLVAIGGPTHAAIGVARPARWVTDSRGYRNSRELETPDLVVVGDSFIAAIGTSQEDTLPDQLNADFGIAALSLGHPGNFRRYRQTLEANEDLFAPGRDPLVFVYAFEGNDFLIEKPEPWRWLTRRRKLRDPIIAFYRTRFDSFGWLNQLWATLGAPNPAARVRVADVDGHAFGFFRDYDEVTERPFYDPPKKVSEALAVLLARADAIFLIPTKARVYQPWVAPDTVLPHAQWETLQTAAREAGGAIVVDLTEPLQERAALLIAQGEFVFWPDDTHWNGTGMRVAAEEAARVYAELRRAAAAR